MSNANIFNLEDKLKYVDLAPSLQALFDILRVRTMIDDIIATDGIAWQDIKIDKENAKFRSDDNFHQARNITPKKIEFKKLLDDTTWETWNYSDKHPKLLNRVFLFDTTTKMEYFFLDKDHIYPVRQPFNLNGITPGYIMKADKENHKIIMDPNYRKLKVCDNTTDLTTLQAIPISATNQYWENDNNIYYLSKYGSKIYYKNGSSWSSKSIGTAIPYYSWMFCPDTNKLFFYIGKNDPEKHYYQEIKMTKVQYYRMINNYAVSFTSPTSIGSKFTKYVSTIAGKHYLIAYNLSYQISVPSTAGAKVSLGLKVNGNYVQQGNPAATSYIYNSAPTAVVNGSVNKVIAEFTATSSNTKIEFYSDNSPINIDSLSGNLYVFESDITLSGLNDGSDTVYEKGFKGYVNQNL